MPILALQRSLRRLGKIRIGDQRPTSNGKTRPAKLDTFRLTSASRESLLGAAGLFGGEVREWEGAPGEGRQFELYTATDTLDIVLPPGDAGFSQFFEMWSGGGCQRRCDGQTDWISNTPCACPADIDERTAQAAKGKACKMTTRLSVILPRVPDLGTWMLETHGYYAAVELGGFVEFVQRQAPGSFVEARLRIDHRTVKRNGETRNFTVPVIELPGLSPAALLAGAAPAGELGARSDETSESVAQAVPAPPMPPTSPSATPGDQPPLPSDAADDWDRRELRERFAALSEEFRVPAWAEWKESRLRRIDDPDLTKEEAEAGARILLRAEEAAKAAYDHRRRHAFAVLGEVGIRDEKTRHAFVKAATDGRTESTGKLEQADLDAIIAACEVRKAELVAAGTPAPPTGPRRTRPAAPAAPEPPDDDPEPYDEDDPGRPF